MKVYGLVSGERGSNAPDKHVVNALNGSLSPSMSDWLLGTGGADKDQRLIRVLHGMFRDYLCELVDAWIDTGKTKEGEQPWNRVVPQWELLRDYVGRNPPALLMAANDPFLVMRPPKTAEDAALAMFLQLLDSPARVRLFRCDGCGTYFMRSRAPKKSPPIQRGVYCAKCKSEGKDSERRTEESRKARTRQIIGLAADEWARWKQRPGCGEQVEWVATQVSRRPYGAAITKNWVRRHQPDIEAELERREHAKG